MRKKQAEILICIGFNFEGGPQYLIDPIASKLGKTTYDADLNDYVVDCDDETLGNMEFTFGKFQVVLTPGDYLYKEGVSIPHSLFINIQIIMCEINFYF